MPVFISKEILPTYAFYIIYIQPADEPNSRDEKETKINNDDKSNIIFFNNIRHPFIPIEAKWEKMVKIGNDWFFIVIQKEYQMS